MNPQTNNPTPVPGGQPAAVPAFDPGAAQIVSAGEPRLGLAPTQYAAPQTAPPQPAAPTTIPLPTTPASWPPAVAAAPSVPDGAYTFPAPAAQPAMPTVGGASNATVPPGQKPAAKPAPHPNSTQNSLQIAEVRDGIVIMNDGSFRAVVMVKSINFDLMSPQEQEAVEYSYQGFLNSLYFPIQIFLRSTRVDLRDYVQRLDKIRTEHDNMLLALLMEDYIDYIDNLSQQTNIMDKNFYVVIPFFPVADTQQALTQSKNFLSGFGGLFDRKEQHVVINEPDLENAKTELRNRVQAILAGLQQCGVQGLPLDTQELIELYYDTYNPDTATRQQLKDFSGLTADVITKGQGAAPQAHLQRELQ